MNIRKQHIIVILAALTAVFSSCGKDEEKVIPRKKMSMIYAEMLVTDQWISSTPGMRMIADTSLVYEPILEKYGYDSEDYRRTVDVYMNDPERFARIFRTSVEMLEDRLEDLRKEQARLDAIARLPRVEVDFKLDEFVPYWGDEPYVHYYDSLVVYMDSATRIYKYISIERSDTLFDGLKIILPDSLSVTDSVSAVSLDSESLKPDSLKMEPKVIRSARIRQLNMDSLKVERIVKR